MSRSPTRSDAQFRKATGNMPPAVASDFRWRVKSGYTCCDTMAPEPHQPGVLCEPDSRQPWFLGEARDRGCLEETLAVYDKAVDRTVANIARGETGTAPD